MAHHSETGGEDIRSHGGCPGAGVRPCPEVHNPLDISRALLEFDNDLPFLKELLDGFMKTVSLQIAAMREAVSDGNSEVLRRAAHSIKGGAANLTADVLSGYASELEGIAGTGPLEKASETLALLEEELSRLEEYAKII
ncbi:MAG TPA: Hpt domain-containing protein [Deltaproteobacteria bacterium]|nr:Hpt domain-containing protein [Deltaproteobacteria bacterium]HPR54931.1 Hpt domain-containing protein [Deltaproteobacteria bacterium]HXK47764.1 Hpt domain-containing protein [Deltaproteobacteria bacterium]